LVAAEPGWDGLGRGLAEVLPSLEERSHLLVSWAVVPTVFVQFWQSSLELLAQTGADDLVPAEQRMGSVAADRMRSLGWGAPAEDAFARRMWHAGLAWPVRSVDYLRLAHMSVSVLRDVHQVPGPAVLEYQAWRDAEPPPLGITYHEENLEPREPHLVFPQLGIRDALAR